MNSIFRVLVFLCCVVALGACDSGSLVWSPDGTKLAFIGSDGLHFSGVDGQLSPRIGEARQVVWLPDSSRLLVVDSEKIPTWNESKAYLSESQQSEAISLSEHLQKLIAEKGLKAIDKDESISNVPMYRMSAALLHLRDGSSKEKLSKLLGKELFDASPSWNMEVSRVCLRDSANQGNVIKELWHGLIDIVEARVSPDGKFVLIVQKKDPDSDLFDISVMSLESPTMPTKVAVTAAEHPDWSADSRQIVFMEGNSGNGKFGNLSWVTVRDLDGSLLKTIGEAKAYLSLVIKKSSDIHCLKDGRILFSAPVVTLPACSSELAGIGSVFTYKPGDRFARNVLSLVDASDESSIGELKVNPGETKAMLGRKEYLHIVDLATGNVDSVRTKLGLPPAWRTADEICFAKENEAKRKNGHDDEIVIYSLSTGKERSISETWPEGAVNEILIHKKDKK